MVKHFKFLTNKPQRRRNQYLVFDADELLLNVIRYKQIHNIDILAYNTPFEFINVPINGWLKINAWRNYDNTPNPTIEIDYSIIEINTTAANFTMNIPTAHLLELIQQWRINERI